MIYDIRHIAAQQLLKVRNGLESDYLMFLAVDPTKVMILTTGGYTLFDVQELIDNYKEVLQNETG